MQSALPRLHPSLCRCQITYKKVVTLVELFTAHVAPVGALNTVKELPKDSESDIESTKYKGLVFGKMHSLHVAAARRAPTLAKGCRLQASTATKTWPNHLNSIPHLVNRGVFTDVVSRWIYER